MRKFLLAFIAIVFPISQATAVNVGGICQSDIYHVYANDVQTWGDASAACNTKNETLAVITNSLQINMVKKCYYHTTTTFKHWIGLRYDGEEGRFVWSDGRVFKCDSDVKVILECNQTLTGSWCFLLTDEGLLQGNCSVPHKYICQALPIGSAKESIATADTKSISEDPRRLVSASLEPNVDKMSSTFAYQNSGVTTTSSRGPVLHMSSSTHLLPSSHVSSQHAANENVLAFGKHVSRKTSALKQPHLSLALLQPSPVHPQTVSLTHQRKDLVDALLSSGVNTAPIGSRPSLIHLQLPSLELKIQGTEMVDMYTTSAYEGNPVSHIDDEGAGLGGPYLGSSVPAVVIPVPRASSPQLQLPSAVENLQLPSKVLHDFESENFIDAYLRNIQGLDVNDYSSLQEAVNLTAELFERTSPVYSHTNVNVLTSTRHLERFSLEYAKKHLSTDNASVVIMMQKDFRLVVQGVTGNKDVFIPLLGNENDPQVLIIMPSSLFESNGGFITVLLYNDISSALPSQAQTSFQGKPLIHSTINSMIAGISIEPYEGEKLTKNISIIFKHAVNAQKQDNLHCVFWNFSERTSFNGSWSPGGCHVINSSSTETACSCDHLTNFAVLMQIKNTEISEKHRLALTTITYIGCTLSLLGEASTIIAYLFFIKTDKDQTRTRLNLVVSIALAQIVFLSGINATLHLKICVFVAMLLHYLFLVAFGWMSVEGLALYFKVVKVYNANMKMRYFGTLAWCVPFLIVLLSIIVASTSDGGITSYVSDDFCWISSANHLVWMFIVPVLFVTLINFLITIGVVREMVKLKTTNSSHFNDVRKTLKAFVTLFPLLGFTWLFGLLTVTDAGLIFQYIFAILNSMQGFFIFVLNVLRSSEFRSTLKRRTMSWSLSRQKSWFFSAEMGSGAKNKDTDMPTKKNETANRRSQSTFQRNTQVYPSVSI